MNIEECYKLIGGDINDVLSRLPNVKFVERFLGKFLDDGSFDMLCTEMENGNRAEAFRAAHTLKGVCQNLGFGTLLSSAEKITELLRPETDTISDDAKNMLDTVKADYQITADTIREYLA